jgi:predicted methyltransferase
MAKKDKTIKFLCKSSDGLITYTTDDKFIYAEKDGTTVRLDLFDEHYYKLRPVNGIPILEIDGLRMQLIRDFKTPLDYAKEVVRQLKIPTTGGSRFVLFDSCMGLGYTAIEAARHPSVKKVLTCELSNAVIKLAQWNPYSELLFVESGKIYVTQTSSFDFISKSSQNSFDFVIHDPPRFSHAPELYSSEFYKELYRVSRPGARLFHYVGSVGKESGRKIEVEVEKRLKENGFKNINHHSKLQGMVFEKP